MIETLDAALYSGEDTYRREQATLLRRAWPLAGHENMMPDPGDYVTDLVGGAPVVAVRGGDGEIRAFHNVCRHRAGPLVDDGCGALRSFVCRYHGWAYGLDGALR